MTKKIKTTVDFSDLKERIRRTKKLMADEKVGEHIADAIVDNIRNNSISPKTGKKYRRLTKSTINNRKYLARHNATHPSYSLKKPNLTITGRLLNSIKAKATATTKGVSYSIDVKGKHAKYSGANGSIGESLTNKEIRNHLASIKRDPLGISKKMNKEILKFIEQTLIKSLKKGK